MTQPGTGAAMKTLDLALPSDEHAPRAARRALDKLQDEVPSGLLENARLLVSELVTNSVRHAAVGDGAVIVLTVHMSAGTVRVEVADAGPGFEPEPPNPSMYQTSGWGLYLVEQIADRWGVARDSGSQVWFELDRPAAQRAS